MVEATDWQRVSLRRSQISENFDFKGYVIEAGSGSRNWCWIGPYRLPITALSNQVLAQKYAGGTQREGSKYLKPLESLISVFRVEEQPGG